MFATVELPPPHETVKAFLEICGHSVATIAECTVNATTLRRALGIRTRQTRKCGLKLGGGARTQSRQWGCKIIRCIRIVPLIHGEVELASALCPNITMILGRPSSNKVIACSNDCTWSMAISSIASHICCLRRLGSIACDGWRDITTWSVVTANVLTESTIAVVSGKLGPTPWPSLAQGLVILWSWNIAKEFHAMQP